jgi:hypothetical protein
MRGHIHSPVGVAPRPHLDQEGHAGLVPRGEAGTREVPDVDVKLQSPLDRPWLAQVENLVDRVTTLLEEVIVIRKRKPLGLLRVDPPSGGTLHPRWHRVLLLRQLPQQPEEEVHRLEQVRLPDVVLPVDHVDPRELIEHGALPQVLEALHLEAFDLHP